MLNTKLIQFFKKDDNNFSCLAEKKYVELLSNFQDIKKCSICGKTDRKVNIHHIDGNCKNFLISNLEPICVSCYPNFFHESQKRPYIKVSRSFIINAAHFLPHDEKCKNLHGHSWKIELCIRKRVNPSTGMVMNFNDIKYFEKYIKEKLNNTLLNDNIANPTAEELLIWIWEKLMFDSLMKGIYSITTWETDNNKASININDMLSVFPYKIKDYLKVYGIKKSC